MLKNLLTLIEIRLPSLICVDVQVISFIFRCHLFTYCINNPLGLFVVFLFDHDRKWTRYECCVFAVYLWCGLWAECSGKVPHAADHKPPPATAPQHEAKTTTRVHALGSNWPFAFTPRFPYFFFFSTGFKWALFFLIKHSNAQVFLSTWGHHTHVLLLYLWLNGFKRQGLSRWVTWAPAIESARIAVSFTDFFLLPLCQLISDNCSSLARTNYPCKASRLRFCFVAFF